MKTLNYSVIPQIEAKKLANRYLGNSLREAIQLAKRHGENSDPIMSFSKSNMTIVYYPSPLLDALVLKTMTEAQAKKDAEKLALNVDNNRSNAISRTRDVIAVKLAKQGIKFSLPSIN